MSYLISKHFPEWSFGHYTELDGTLRFYWRINALLNPEDTVADLGCGRGGYFDQADQHRIRVRNLRGKCRKVLGLDVDPLAATNPSIDEFHLIPPDTGRLPLPDESVNLCFSDQVVEHLENPRIFFGECHRILIREGYLCVRTTNAYGYVALLARLIPGKFHSFILRKSQPNRESIDIFPTYFRCNSPRKLKQLLGGLGFQTCILMHEGEPSYLEFSSWAFRIGLLLPYLIPSFFRNSILIYAKKL